MLFGGASAVPPFYVCGVSAAHRKLLAMMERKQKLMSGAQEDLRGKIFQELRFLDETISAEEIDLLEKKQAMMELLKGSAQVEEWRGTDVAGSWVTRLSAAESRSSATEGGLFLTEV